MPHIVLLTGPAASGKNTIAHIYATEFSDRCAVIDTDLVRWMLRNPHLAPWPTDPPDSPAQDQHRLGIKHACMLARSFAAEGYNVVICDVVGDRLAQHYRDLLAGCDFRILRLLPDWDEALSRLRQRDPSITEDEAKMLYDQQQHMANYDATLDNSALPPQKVATWIDRVLAHERRHSESGGGVA
jgi:chloramphenicol 3-O-phosphotransferase